MYTTAAGHIHPLMAGKKERKKDVWWVKKEYDNPKKKRTSVATPLETDGNWHADEEEEVELADIIFVSELDDVIAFGLVGIIIF